MLTFFEDIKAYVGFSDADSEALAAFAPDAAPHFGRISDHFYERIRAHPSAHAAIRGGAAQVERLKRTLVEWMESGLKGPHDEAFFERRSRIGRVHVRIGLPQHYMVTAMDVVRLDFREVLEGRHGGDAAARRRVGDALERLFDLELTIMLESYREDSEDRLRRRERLATIGQVAAGIGHDLRNPLGVIESSLYLIRKGGAEDERLASHLDKISSAVRSSNRIITDLLEMARDRPPRREPVDLEAVVEEAVRAASVPDTLQVAVDIEEGIGLRADHGLLVQALVNLVSNSASALEGRRGHIWIGAMPEGPGEIVLSVADDGPGFSPETLAVAFEPLVTTRATGIGLGLALVGSIAQRHGGRAEAGNRPAGGALVRIILPTAWTDGPQGPTSSG